MTEVEREKLLDELARVFARAAVDAWLAEQAVDIKIEEQKEFVGWWRDNVSANHGGNRKQVRGSSHLNFEQAEELTGITQQQVSRWAKSVRDETDDEVEAEPATPR